MHVSEPLLDYVQALVAYTRESRRVRSGPVAARRHRAGARVAGLGARCRHAGVHPEDVQAVLGAVVGASPQARATTTRSRPRDRRAACCWPVAVPCSHPHSMLLTAPCSIAALRRPATQDRAAGRVGAATARHRPADRFLKRRRIYIVPTRFGIVFTLMVFAMLLGSMNYANDLGLRADVPARALALMAMHHCHNNLAGMQISFARERAGIRRADARFRVALEQRGQRRAATRSSHANEHGNAPPARRGVRRARDVRPGCRAPQRGLLRLDRSTSSRAIRAVCSAPGRGCTWNRAASSIRAAPARRGRCRRDGRRRRAGQDHGDEDFAGLRAASPGDSPQRIAWKAYARNHVLQVKEFAGAAGRASFDWDVLQGLGPKRDCRSCALGRRGSRRGGPSAWGCPEWSSRRTSARVIGSGA